MSAEIDIIECPRDAMQGIEKPIPTPLKTAYINSLLKVGFHTIDFGSFVSPKAVPQMADTAQVLAGLETAGSPSRLLAIVVNLRGAETACQYPQIHYLGYPFSISETFQLRNSRKTLAQSLQLVEQIQALCQATGKELVVYLSMAFGNPYGDPWSPTIAQRYAASMVERGVKVLSLADTTGVAQPHSIQVLFEALIPRFPQTTFGAHFHSHPASRMEKIEAAYGAGCRRFDVALQGYGGCPFAEDELVGNIATESLLEFCKQKNIQTNINLSFLQQAQLLAQQVFS